MPKQRLPGRLGIADGVLHLCPDRRVEPLRDLVAEGHIGIQRLAGGAGHARSKAGSDILVYAGMSSME